MFPRTLYLALLFNFPSGSPVSLGLLNPYKKQWDFPSQGGDMWPKRFPIFTLRRGGKDRKTSSRLWRLGLQGTKEQSKCSISFFFFLNECMHDKNGTSICLHRALLPQLLTHILRTRFYLLVCDPRPGLLPHKPHQAQQCSQAFNL